MEPQQEDEQEFRCHRMDKGTTQKSERNSAMIKQEQANRLIKKLEQPVMSSQVIRELGHNLHKKAAYQEPSIRQTIANLYRDCTVEVNCNILHSEDMQHNQKVSHLTIVNPFLLG